MSEVTTTVIDDWADLHQAVWEGPRWLSRCSPALSTTPGRCLRTGQSRRDNRRRARHARKGHHHWTLVAEQLLHRVTDQGYADSAGPADLHREVVPDSKV